eukprot:Gb_14158 [translate_table: standard]
MRSCPLRPPIPHTHATLAARHVALAGIPVVITSGHAAGHAFLRTEEDSTVVDALKDNEDIIRRQNEYDVLVAQEARIAKTLVSRLTLKPGKISGLAKLITSLAIQGGNGLFLKSGKEAAQSNAILQKVITEALPKSVGRELISLVTSRDEIPDLLKLDDFIDLVFPRGCNKMVSKIKESTFIPLNLRPLIFYKPNGGIHAANYSVQTGEEFADLIGILGIGQRESGNNSDISMLVGDRGNLSKFGSNCNPAHTDLCKECNFSLLVNNGLYQSDGLIDPSTCEAEFQATSCYSMHRLYLSGPSDDSSSGKVNFMCSFGGKIQPRSSDGKLRYAGEETCIIAVNKDIAYGELMQKMMDIYGQALILKYHLSDEDLDAMVFISSDEDLENMIEEYDRLENNEGSSRL